MILSEFDPFYALAESTPPTDVSAYVKQIGWQLQQSGDAWEQWIQPREDGSPRAAWMLPLDRVFADYDRRIAQLLHAAAEQQEINASELKSKLAHIHSDSFSLLICSSDADFIGSVYILPQLAETIKKLVEDSARFTDHPYTTFKGGRRSGRLERFLNKELTVETAPGSDPGVVVHVHLPSLREATKARAPYGRRVLENLFRAVRWTHGAYLSSPNDESPEFARLGWQVHKTLADFSKRTGATSAEFSFNWSSSVSRSEDIIAKSFHFDHLPALAESPLNIILSRPTYDVAASLPLTEREVSFSGKIDDIFLGPHPVQGAAECWVNLAWSGGPSGHHLKVNLSEDDYMDAVAARLTSQEVSVEGIARPEGRRTWIFEGTLTFPAGRAVTIRPRPDQLP